MNLRCEIFDMLRDHIGANIAKRVSNVVDVLKLAAQVEDFPPVTDRIALANGTLYLDGTFQEGKSEIVRNRLPVKYDLKAVQPVHWLQFLSDLLYPEDIPTVQEFIGYCLIPSNKGQRMMVIKGSGGEGKSQIGVMLSRLFGCNMKDGSIGKISENRFARADLEHILLCVDDDMRMEVLRQTNYEVYKMWCEENSLNAIKSRGFSDALIANQRRYNLESTNNIINSSGRRVRGFVGIETLVQPDLTPNGWRA